MIASAIWGHAWKDQHVLFHCDNMAVVEQVKHGSGRGPEIAHLLRCLVFFGTHFGFQLSIAHIADSDNTAVDALSHNNLTTCTFSSFFPQVQRCLIPQPGMELLVKISSDWGSHSWITGVVRSRSRACHSPGLPYRTTALFRLLQSFSPHTVSTSGAHTLSFCHISIHVRISPLYSAVSEFNTAPTNCHWYI